MSGVVVRNPPKMLLCAGQACAARETCARHRIRGAEFRWASFDLELAMPKFKDKPCPSYLVYRETRQGVTR